MAPRRASDWALPEHDQDTATPTAEPVARKAAVGPIGADLLRLQRSAGNAAVVGLLAAGASGAETVQRKNGRQRAAAAKKRAAATTSTTPAPSTPAQAQASTTTVTAPAQAQVPAISSSAASAPAQTQAPVTTGPASTGPASPTTPAPAPRDPKVVALEAVIGAGPMQRMATQLGGEAQVVTFAAEMGAQKLKTCIETYKMTAAQLQTVGAKRLKTFVGVGEAAWRHVSTAHLNGVGSISGGHDADAFYACLDENDYEITYERDLGDGITKVEYASADGSVTGSKTIVDGLASAKASWMAKFNSAIWNALKSGTLVAGRTSYARGDDTYDYGYFYRSGANQVDTVFPG